MLARFVPLGVREPVFTVEDVPPRPPLGAGQIATRGVVGGLIVGAAGFVLDAALFAVKTMRETKGAGFDLGAAMWRLAHPMTDHGLAGGRRHRRLRHYRGAVRGGPDGCAPRRGP